MWACKLQLGQGECCLLRVDCLILPEWSRGVCPSHGLELPDSSLCSGSGCGCCPVCQGVPGRGGPWGEQVSESRKRLVAGKAPVH